MEYTEGLMRELDVLVGYEKTDSLTKVGVSRIKALRKCQSDFKKLHLPNVSHSASDFEKDLGKLINDYVKAGLKKPDLVKKMEWMTGNCKFS
tara:strand:+ start:194 stop:469 length:276 start_codon:yes stop_codon:yes gene_type:complete